MPPSLKLVKDLEPGDRAMIDAGQVVTVLALVPSVQTVRRKVVLVTFRGEDGREIHRTYNEGSTMKMQRTP
jgi:copper(I)-binding protein